MHTGSCGCRKICTCDPIFNQGNPQYSRCGLRPGLVFVGVASHSVLCRGAAGIPFTVKQAEVQRWLQAWLQAIAAPAPAPAPGLVRYQVSAGSRLVRLQEHALSSSTGLPECSSCYSSLCVHGAQSRGKLADCSLDLEQQSGKTCSLPLLLCLLIVEI